ncbi:MAG: hypothetical protein R3B93_08935 [Bacteroidia bacterium]
MKKLLLISLLWFLALGLSAQVPSAFKYQAVARNNNNNSIPNQQISLRISILNNAMSPVYSELHNPTTNNFGIFSLEIGRGQVLSGTFNSVEDIPWHSGSKYIQVEMDPMGGTNYQPYGSSELLSVPYAMQAGNKPFYDSGWFPMSSQAGANSYKELSHNLGEYPTRVKVLVKAIGGDNDGFIFEGTGSVQADDDNSENYGGVVFAYSQTKIRLWAPTQNNGSASGRIISIEDGWGNEINRQASNNAEVRVLVWR